MIFSEGSESYVINFSERVFETAPVGYRFSLFKATLRVLSSCEVFKTSKIRSRIDKTQPLGAILKENSEYELDGTQWQKVQGDGYLLLLTPFDRAANPKFSSTRPSATLAFLNGREGQFEAIYPSKQLYTMKTNLLVEKKTLFGKKEVPFTHSDESLRSAAIEILDLCRDKYLAVFAEAHRDWLNYLSSKNGEGSPRL